MRYLIHRLCINLKQSYYIVEKHFFATELSNFKITLPLAKLDMVTLRFVSIFFIISDDIPNDIPLVTFLLLSNIRKLSIRAKVGNSDNHHCL